MKKMSKKVVSILLIGCIFVSFCGCGKKEITEDDITNSKTYKNLDANYNQLERKYQKLKDEKKQYDRYSSEKKHTDALVYLETLKNCNISKVGYRYNVESISDMMENKSLGLWLRNCLTNGYVDVTQSAEELLQNEAEYTYTLYKEDNSICKCQVYEGNFVIYDEYPTIVFYVPNALRLGDGLIRKNEFLDKPNRSIYTQLYDNQFAFSGDNLMSQKRSREFAKLFYTANAKKIESRPIDLNAEYEKKYTFYCDGVRYDLQLYTKFMSVVSSSSQVIWYAIDEKKLENLKKI